MSKTKNKLFHRIARLIQESNDKYIDDQYHYDKQKNKTVKLKPEKGNDGLYRIMIDVYYYFGGAGQLQKLLTEQTGISWIFLGCFMESCCFATAINKEEFEFTYPWNDSSWK